MRKRQVRGLVLSRSRCLCSRCRSLQGRRWHSSRKTRCRSSIPDMIERSKTTPGGLTYGSTGTNSSQHLSIELLKRVTGANLVHVPYRGSAPAVVDVIGGQIPLASVDLTSAYPHIQAGRLRA